MIRMKINGREVHVAEGRTLLEACREHGIHIPTLCYHPALEPYGGCRLCMVEIKQPERDPRLVAACVYPCEEYLEVQTDNQRVKNSRRMTAELLLASASDTPEILKLAEELGVQQLRFKHPEEQDCVLCGQCVRACEQIVGVSAISVINRGIRKKVSTPFEIASSRCIGCGTCALICPTGAIKISDVTGIQPVSSTKTVYKSGYYRTGGELDLRPNFIDDLTPLLGKQPGNGADHD